MYNLLPFQNQIQTQEYWEPIKEQDYPGIFQQYFISTYGRVYDCISGQIWPKYTEVAENKYIVFNAKFIYGYTRPLGIHRVMLITFSPNPNASTLVANHKDGIKCHNWIWNLEWSTVRDNMIHAVNNGLVPMGNTRNNGLVPDEFVHEICKLIQDGYSPEQIQNMLTPPVKCDFRRLITNIKNGHCHSFISKNYDFSNAWNVNDNDRKFTEDQIHIICKYFQDHGKNATTKEICDILNIDYGNLDLTNKRRYFAAVSAIRNKKTFNSICDLYDY